MKQAIDSLKESLAAGSAYEGQQTVKATTRRLRSRRKVSSGYALLGEAAVLLWRAGELSCALDLAKALLQVHKSVGLAARQKRLPASTLES